MQEKVLPKVQEAFIRHYTSYVDTRNGKVKKIEDDVILPSLCCDGDPCTNLMEIKDGSVK